MPFIPNTPEAHTAILSPSTPQQCRGLNNDGKPCRRTLTRTPAGVPSSGILTIVNKSEAYFCAKHQEQAKDIVLRHTASFSRRRALVGRGSLDTLIEQVEVLVDGGVGGGTVRTKVVSTTTKVPKEEDPFRRIAEESEESDESFKATPKPPTPPGMYRKKKPIRPTGKRGFLKRLIGCCFAGDDSDPEEPMNEKRKEAELRSAAAGVVDETHPQQAGPRVAKGGKSNVAFEFTPPTPPLPQMDPVEKTTAGSALKPHAPVHTVAGSKGVVGLGMSPATPGTPSTDDEEDVKLIDPKQLNKEQQKVLRLIPSTLPAKAIARLQAEVLKPFSDKDEPGYIYMFWLTDSPLSPYSTPAATPGATPGASSPNTRLFRAAATLTPGGSRPNLLFKIGRTNNVQRRLHEWTTQCNYNLQLIRYYPHTSGSRTADPVGRTVPNSHRIERLIHLELEAMPGSRPDVRCEACGKGHQEWFEIAGSREGVEGVDEVIQRWIKFGEDYAGRDLGAVPKPSISAKAYRAGTPAAPASTRKSGATATATATATARASSPSAPLAPAPAATRKSGAAATATATATATASSARQTRAPTVSTQATPPRPKPQRLPAKSQVKMYNTKPKKTTPPKGAAGGRKKAAKKGAADSDGEWGEGDYSPDEEEE